LGSASGDAGWIVATLMLFPFAQGKITLWGEPGKSQVFLPALVIFVLLCSPMLVLFKEKKDISSGNTTGSDLKSITEKTVSGIKELFRSYKNVAWFLVAFCFISDAILTINLYFAVIIDRLYHVPDAQKLRFLLLMFIFNIIGDYVLGKASDSVGAKKTVFFSSLLLMAIFLIAFLSSTPWVLYPIALCAGIGWGGFYSASRALLTKISPQDRLGEYFGFYSAFQKFASIVGPLVWGIAVLALKGYGDINYRIAGFLMICLMGIGLLFLKSVQEEKVVV
jgi:UMF1 family MFS transporter